MTIMLLIMCAPLVLVGCGKDDDDEEAAVADTILKGVWKTACTETVKSTVDATNVQLVNSNEIFKDASCTTSSFTTTMVADYTIGADVTSPAGAKEIDLTTVSLKMTIKAADMVVAFNQLKYCTISDWAVDVERDITGKACGSGSSTVTTSAGDKDYSIVKVDGTTLTFGKSSTAKDGKSAANRENELDDTIPFTKQ